MNVGGSSKPRGDLTAILISDRARPAPLMDLLRNRARPAYLRGALTHRLARLSGAVTIRPTLSAIGIFLRDEDRLLYESLAEVAKRDPDERVQIEMQKIRRRRYKLDYGILSYRVITDAGVAFLVDDWDTAAQEITNMNYHASGTGAVAEAVGDTALGAEATTITDRVAGTKSQPAANQLRSVGTQSYTGAGAITEHGLFSVITESSGILWDRSVFAAINVGNGDSIQWTYTCTVNSGG